MGAGEAIEPRPGRGGSYLRASGRRRRGRGDGLRARSESSSGVGAALPGGALGPLPAAFCPPSLAGCRGQAGRRTRKKRGRRSRLSRAGPSSCGEPWRQRARSWSGRRGNERGRGRREALVRGRGRERQRGRSLGESLGAESGGGLAWPGLAWRGWVGDCHVVRGKKGAPAVECRALNSSRLCSDSFFSEWVHQIRKCKQAAFPLNSSTSAESDSCQPCNSSQEAYECLLQCRTAWLTPTELVSFPCKRGKTPPMRWSTSL